MRASSETSTTMMGSSQVRDLFAQCRERVDARLDQLVPSETMNPASVHSAIRWSLFAGGKRFRPALLMATGEAFGAPPHVLLDTACAL